MNVRYPETGICGLSCRLCPHYHTAGSSRCSGCKTESRMSAGCPFITCGLKRKGVEFCWDCDEGESCGKWKKHREAAKTADSFKCYQTLEEDIAFVRRNGIDAFEKAQEEKKQILVEMLQDFNEGRSKSYYCIAVTIMETGELGDALAKARKNSRGLDIKERAGILHAILDTIAREKNYCLKLRK